MWHSLGQYIYDLIGDIVPLSEHLVLLVIILVAAVIVLDSVTAHAKKARLRTGMAANTPTLGVDDSKTLPSKVYISEIQRLSGKPDALIREDGFVIPVERKPLARKVRDRYVAQLLIYMRLVEEFEGKRPPHGYLILGPTCRRVKIVNSESRQAWVQGLINEMHAILEGAEARGTPQQKKCDKCDVSQYCTQRYVAPARTENTAAASSLQKRA